jgi:serine protease Do
MKFRLITGKNAMLWFGLLLIAFGSAGWLNAQRQPAPRVVQFTLDGAYLGIQMEDVTAENVANYRLGSETGVVVRSVAKGSPAEIARLQEKDVILEYAGIPVFSAAALARLVQETPVNRTVNMVVSRDGKKLNLSAKLGEREGALYSDRVGRQFEILPPGTGSFQFRLPGEAGRTPNIVLPRVLQRPQLGVTVLPLTDQLGEFLGVPGRKGLLVTAVTAGSPAASLLRAGDVITSVDGKAVTDSTELTRALAGKEPGAKVDLKVIRDKKEIAVSVEFPKSGTAQRGVKI